jgi:hypothetical protein
MSSYRCRRTYATPVPVAHLSADVATIYIYIKLWSGCHPYFGATLKVPFLILIQTTGAHHEIYKTTGVYIGKKKLCLSNKHLVIFWVKSIGYADNFVFPIVTQD